LHAWGWVNEKGGDVNSVPCKEVFTMLFLPQEEGQGLTEYALILVSVAVVVIVILGLLGPMIGNIFSNIYVNV